MLVPFVANGISVSEAIACTRWLLKRIDLRRMMVHPDHQRKGIAQKMLQWGMDLADREKIVGWLFARPAGSRLYEKNGWKAVTSTEVDVPDIKVAPVVSMLRVPRPFET